MTQNYRDIAGGSAARTPAAFVCMPTVGKKTTASAATRLNASPSCRIAELCIVSSNQNERAGEALGPTRPYFIRVIRVP